MIICGNFWGPTFVVTNATYSHKTLLYVTKGLMLISY